MAKMPGMKIKISGYTVVTAGSSDGLVEKVLQDMQEGWVPIGGVGLVTLTRFDQEEIIYGQALVRINIDTDGI